MKKTIWAIILLISTLCFSVSCSKDDDEKEVESIVGIWSEDDSEGTTIMFTPYNSFEWKVVEEDYKVTVGGEYAYDSSTKRIIMKEEYALYDNTYSVSSYTINVIKLTNKHLVIVNGEGERISYSLQSKLY